ncbi:MAG: hypothetical protein Q9170_005557 [Blastenia crenularia]
MSKKSLLVFASSCQFQNILHPSSIIPTTQSSHPPRNGKSYGHRRKPRIQVPCRFYATAKDEQPHASMFDDIAWPEVSTPSAIPTPYEIFQLHKTAPYSKRRFYHLVKLYHPDRHGHYCNNPDVDLLSQDAKMKRYRLVVAANDILSDPSRRKAYDLHGAGWSGHPDVGGSASNADPAMKKKWSGFHDNGSPAGNATWEDWEEWYQRNSKGAQTPVYTSNAGFITLVAFVAVLSALSQGSRLDDHQQVFANRIELVHNDCSKNIQCRRNETMELSNMEQAILRFMRSREQGGMPARYSISDPDDFDREGLLPPD